MVEGQKDVKVFSIESNKKYKIVKNIVFSICIIDMLFICLDPNICDVDSKVETSGVIKTARVNGDGTASALLFLLEGKEDLTNEEVDALFNTVVRFVHDYEEYAPYINFDNLVYRMREFEIEHYDERINELIAGESMKRENKMKIYHEDNSDYLRTVTHEAFHLTHVTSSCKFIEEGVTSLLVSEYYDPVSDKITIYSYSYFIPIIRQLCELLGSDVMLACYFSGDVSLIKDKLIEIDGNEDRALMLIDLLTTAGNTEGYYVYHPEEYTTEQYNEFMKQKINDITEYIIYYYETKYGKKVSDDLVMSSLISSNKLGDNIFSVVKYYFNKSAEKTRVFFNDGTFEYLDDYLSEKKSMPKKL